MPRVSIVIPTRNAGDAFTDTLDAIAAQDLGEPFELVVVDSGSTDGTSARAARYGARIIAIAPAEFGHGRTRNLGIAQSTGDYVVLLVQDAVPADGAWLAELVAELDAHPRVAGAFSASLPGPNLGPIARALADERCQHLGSERIARALPEGCPLTSLPFARRSRLCAFDNVSSIIRRAVWERTPFRDVAFAEDVAWASDVLRAGYATSYVPASRVYHAHDRAPDYALRRNYVDSLTVGELLGEPTLPLDALTALRLYRLWQRVERGDVPDDLLPAARHASSLEAAARCDPEDATRTAFRQRFGLPALRRLVGPRSRCTLTEQLGMLYHMDRYIEDTLGHASRQEGALKRLFSRPDVRVLAGVSLGWRRALNAELLTDLFDALQLSPYRDLLERAISESLGASEPRAFRSLVARIRSRACELAARAGRYAELDGALCALSYRYAAAEVIGRRIGAGMRDRRRTAWRRALHARLTRGI